MKGLILLLNAILLSTNFTQTSSIYIPLNIQEAIEKGTRTTEGIPGEKYWQNSSVYEIDAEILADSSILKGDEKIIYFNNSPDTLKQIVVRLYQDISKIGATRDWYFGGDNLNEGVKLKYLIVDGDTLDVSTHSRDIRRGSTNMVIRLKNGLSPNSNISLNIGWEFEIPQILRLRMGNYGNGNFYIAYWYPQIAVYDDIDGWDRIDYNGMVEFYNDFSDYNVNIKVPEGMVVWATGDLQNAKEVLRNDIYKKYQEAKKSDQTIRIINQEDYSKGVVTAPNKYNVWKFKAERVNDFTFATSKSFNWDGASVVVDPESGRRSLTDVIYKDSTIHYDQGAQYARETIKYLSEVLPGYPYPYSHATTYCNGNNRGGGMESPMMANNGAPADRPNHVGLIFHEIAHNYFPFIMGTNERKYAWMDEGWASFLPTDLVDAYDPDYGYRNRRVASYERGAGNESDLPLVIPSYSYKTGATRLGFYDRPANAYYELKELLGEELFKQGMLEYMNRWSGKHPLPTDFFLTFNQVAGEDLSWFWNPWFYDFGYPDLAILNVENSEGTATATIKKIGNIPSRVNIIFELEDGTKKTVLKPSSIWKDGNDTIKLSIDTKIKVTHAVLGNDNIPDVTDSNNYFEIID